MLLTILLVDSTTRNMLMHYGQVTIDNVCAHVTTYVGMHTRGTQDNDMFYYVLVNCFLQRTAQALFIVCSRLRLKAILRPLPLPALCLLMEWLLRVMPRTGTTIYRTGRFK